MGIGDGGGRGDRRGTGTGIRTCRIQIQVEYSECCCILGVFWLYELDYMLYLDIIKGHYRKNIKCLKGIHSRPVSVYIRILRSALWVNKLLLYPSVKVYVGLNSILFPPLNIKKPIPQLLRIVFTYEREVLVSHLCFISTHRSTLVS